MKRRITLMCVVLLLAGALHAAVVIKPLSVTETSPEQVYVDLSFNAVIDGSGLSAPMNTGDAIPGTLPTHVVGDAGLCGRYWSWDVYYGQVTFDLGALFNVDRLYFWNYAELYNGLSYTGKGMRYITVSFSTDGENFTDPVSIFPAQLPDQVSNPQPNAPETFNFTPIQARFIKFGEFDWYDTTWAQAGFGEVRFAGDFLTPVILEQPVSATVAVGQPVTFDVNSINTSSYQWYKNEVAIDGATEPNYTIASVALLDEGQYYCKLSSGTADVNTAVVNLLTNKLVARWSFEGNLSDSEADWDGALYTVNELGELVPSSEPNYVAGISGGQAFRFFNDTKHIEIPDSNDAFNFYPQGLTVNCWINLEMPVEQDVWMSFVAKQNATGSDAGFALDYHYDTFSEFFVGAVRSASGAPWGISPLGDSLWHMVTMTWDGSFIRSYVDGALLIVSEEYAGPALPLSTGRLVLGADRSDGSFPFVGSLDEVSIYNYAVDPYTIARTYTDIETDKSVCVNGDELQFDTNDDCVVDLKDFAAFAETWLNCNRVAGSTSTEINCIP